MISENTLIKTQSITVLVVGIMLLGLGAVTLYYPEIMERYGLGIATAEARISTRAIIGGGEIGLGILMLAGGTVGFSMRQRLIIATVLFCSLVSVRLIAIVLEDDEQLAPIVYRELAVEIIIAAALLTILALYRKRRG